MIVVLKNGAPSQKVDELKASLKARGLDLHEYLKKQNAPHGRTECAVPGGAWANHTACINE